MKNPAGRALIATLLLFLLKLPVILLLQLLLPDNGAQAGSYVATIVNEVLLWGLPALLLGGHRLGKGPGGNPMKLLLLLPTGFAAQWAFGLLEARWVLWFPGNTPSRLPGDPAEAVLALIALVLIPAFCEELFFRGMLLRSLRSVASPVGAWLISSLAFALMHGSLSSLPGHLLIGLLLGLCMTATSSLLSCMVLHGAFNASALVIGLLGLENNMATGLASTGWLALCTVVLWICLPEQKENREWPGATRYLAGILLSVMAVPYLLQLSQYFSF